LSTRSVLIEDKMDGPSNSDECKIVT